MCPKMSDNKSKPISLRVYHATYYFLNKSIVSRLIKQIDPIDLVRTLNLNNTKNLILNLLFTHDEILLKMELRLLGRRDAGWERRENTLAANLIC